VSEPKTRGSADGRRGDRRRAAGNRERTTAERSTEPPARRRGPAIVTIALLLAAVALLVVTQLDRSGSAGRRADDPAVAGSGDPSTDALVARIDGLPPIDTEGMELAVRDRVRTALAALASAPESAEAWGRLGKVCDIHGLLDVAELAYRRATALDPVDERWPYFLARVIGMRGGDPLEAERLYERTAADLPDHAPLQVRWAESLLQRGEVADAIERFEHAIELDPDLLRAHRGLGQALLAAQRPHEALAVLEPARDRFPEDAGVRQEIARALAMTGRTEEARAARAAAAGYEVLTEMHDDVFAEVAAEAVSSNVLIRRADRRLVEGDFERAEATYRTLLPVRPDDGGLRVSLGLARAGLGRHPEALEAFDLAIEVEPGEALAHRHRGSTLMVLDRYEEAAAAFDEAFRLDPRDVEAAYGRAIARQRSGQDEAANIAFHEADALAPPPVEAAFRWGNALIALGLHREAVDRYDQAIAAAPDFAAAHANRAAALQRMGRLGAAIESMERALELAPSDAYAERLVQLRDERAAAGRGTP